MKLLLSFLGAAAAAGAEGAALPGFHADDSSLTVSGISSGAFMAVQLHVAFSKRFHGAGVIAGGPFYCAQANVLLAEEDCMRTPSLIDVGELESITRNTALTGTIDAPSHLSDSRVWMFSGSNDTVVDSGVVSKLQDYYGRFITEPHSIAAVIDEVEAEHAWITADYGNDCGFLGEPYMNNCGYDAAGAMLQHLFKDALTAPVAGAAPTGDVIEFDQREFVGEHYTMYEAAMAGSGYVYAPKACQDGSTRCQVHVALHGCEMSTDVIGDKFAVNSGLNTWADANDFLILYPQATANELNPKYCFDWFAFTGVDYASKLGVQMQAVPAMVDRLASSS